MFSQEEQEEIINKFLGVIEMKEVINNKVSMCSKCKFNQQNMNLYKLDLPDNVIKNICKYNYEECKTCKTLKELKEHVYDCSITKFENAVDAIEDEDKYNIQNYTSEEINTKVYYYVNLNTFPTYNRVVKQILKEDTAFYTKDIHKEIKCCYTKLFGGYDQVSEFYTNYRNKIVEEYHKKIDRATDTRTIFTNYLDEHMRKVTDAIKQITKYIASNEEHNKVEHQLYSAETSSWIQRRMTDIVFNDAYSWERYMDARFPYLSKEEYTKRMKKHNPTRKNRSARNDEDYLNSISINDF